MNYLVPLHVKEFTQILRNAYSDDISNRGNIRDDNSGCNEFEWRCLFQI